MRAQTYTQTHACKSSDMASPWSGRRQSGRACKDAGSGAWCVFLCCVLQNPASMPRNGPTLCLGYMKQVSLMTCMRTLTASHAARQGHRDLVKLSSKPCCSRCVAERRALACMYVCVCVCSSVSTSTWAQRASLPCSVVASQLQSTIDSYSTFCISSIIRWT